MAIINFTTGLSSLGWVLAAKTERGICAIFMGESQEQLVRDLQRCFVHAAFVPRDDDVLMGRVVSFLETPREGLGLPLDPQGTAFQVRVWEALQRIPAGQTVSYTQLAQAIGAPSSARAVARACATNSIAVAIPCHRVVRTGGDVSGYRWGVPRKEALLQREREQSVLH